MDARWVDAVGQLWMDDAEIDMDALEKKWQLLPLETNGPEPGNQDRGRLLLCMTGFDDRETLPLALLFFFVFPSPSQLRLYCSPTD